MSSNQDLPALLLPGMDGTGKMLTAFAAQFSTCRPVHVISYPTDQALGYDNLSALVVSKAPTGPFVIIGESFSGPIAIEVAATLPNVVGLVLASSFARHPAPSFLTPMARIFDLAWIPNSMIVAALMGSAGTPELADRIGQVLAGLPREVIRRRAIEVLKVDKRIRLREVRCPILCLHGRFDRLVGKRMVSEITSEKPACKVEWFDAPHMLLETNPRQAAEAINRFCQRLDRPQLKTD